MRPKSILLLVAGLLFTSFLFAQDQTPPESSPELNAFRGIVELLRNTKPAGTNLTAEDLKTRRETGVQIAAKAKQFLKDYPASEKADDAQALASLGLMQAAIAGDTAAADELKTRAADLIKDPKTPDMLKLHVFSVNYMTQWAIKNGLHNLDAGTPESQKAYREAFFAAANVLPNKEPIFKMLLLQARSGHELSTEERHTIAQHVLDNTNASPAIQAQAKQILSGEEPYTIGKPVDISFVAVDGKKINLADMKGKVVLIDFWATWCGPCVAEMPTVKATYDKYHAQGFEIIGISLDESKDSLLRFLKQRDIPWPQYFDGKHWNNEISSRFGIEAIPAEWLIDKKGILRNTEARANLEESVKALLDEK